MKRAFSVVAAVCLVATGALTATAPATADDATSLLIGIRWAGSTDKGDPVVASTTKRRIVAAYGALLTPFVVCTGPDCDPGRPARIEILDRGTWKPWSSGTLAELSNGEKVLTAKRTTSIVVRSTLPAHGTMPSLSSLRWSIRFLPGTTVAISGTTVIKASPANDYQWQFRPGPGTVTVNVTPAAAGRVLELRDSMVEGYPLIARVTTDARGQATITDDFTDVKTLAITVVPTVNRAGWNAYASPVT